MLWFSLLVPLSQLCLLLVEWPWAISLTSVCFSFLIFEMEMIVVPASEGCKKPVRESLFNACRECPLSKCELWIITRLFHMQFVKQRYIGTTCPGHWYYLSKVHKISYPITKIITSQAETGSNSSEIVVHYIKAISRWSHQQESFLFKYVVNCKFF